MKKNILISAVLMVLSGWMNAQTIISNQSLVTGNDMVVVTFDVETDVKSIPSRRKEVIMPFIYNTKDTLWLDVLEVYGKGRFKRERQENHIAGDKDWELSDNQVIKGDVYHYAAAVPLKRWMKSTNLGIKRHMVGCACEDDMEDETLAENVALFKEPLLPSRRIPAEYVLSDAKREWDFGQDELEIVFKVSKTDMDPAVFDNEVTFGKILSAVDKIKSNPKYRLEKIEVAGYASPEGPPDFNKWLGENRAKALINYIIEHRPEYALTMDDFRIVNGEENWAGLRRVVASSDLDKKDEVLAIIDDKDMPDERRKLRIEALDNGFTWKKMLREIYPYLRCSRYLSVYYDSTDDGAVEAINDANSMIREGRYQEAYETALQYSDDLRAFNTIGVALMMQGLFEEALPWLEKAVEANTPSAQANIDVIKAELEAEAKNKAEIEAFLKKYE